MEAVQNCLERFKKGQLSLMTSVLTVTEITVAKIPAGIETQLDEVMQRSNFTRLSVDIRVAKLARDLRNHYLIDQHYNGNTVTVPDSLHLATAILYRATEFHTFDENNTPRYKSLGLLPLSGNVAGHNLVIRKPPMPTQMTLGL